MQSYAWTPSMQQRLRTGGPITSDDIVATGGDGLRDLAYLSACDSSRGRLRLADEGAHMAGAFKAAGFQHVIATAWYLGDRIAVSVTDEFYRAVLGGESIAAALHQAVRACRERVAGDPGERRRGALVWGPFMHFGP